MDKVILTLIIFVAAISLAGAATYNDCSIYGNCQPVKAGTSTSTTTTGAANLTIEETDGSPSVVNVNKIAFSDSSGFHVLDNGDNSVNITLGSAWYTIIVSGQDTMSPTGEENIEFVAGTDITITTNNASDPKSITWTSDVTGNSTIARIGNCPAGEVAVNTTATGVQCVNLATVFHNATQALNVTGTIVGELSYTQHQDGDYDGKTLNITEQVSAPALDMRMNFTGISSFNGGLIRYYTSSITGDNPLIQVWNYDTSDWETYATMGETSSFATIDQTVYDDSEHISNGVVQMRLYKASTGNINNKYYVDWVAIYSGFGTPSGMEVDPYSIHTDALNYSWFNFTNGILQFIGTIPSSGGNATFNQTLTDSLYAEKKWGYNMSDGSYNITYQNYAYNQTYTAGTYNVTYHKWAYNQSDGSYNVTYAKYAYNETYTGGTCTGGQVVQNTTQGGVQCITPTASASPAGSNTQVQFNDGGSLGANSNFTYNKTTNKIIVGESTSAIDSNSGTFANLVVTNAGTYSGIYAYSASNSPSTAFPFFNGRFARGTLQSPTATGNDDKLIRFGAGGYDGNTWTPNQGAVETRASQNWNTTAKGTYSVFMTTQSDTTLMRDVLQITDKGHIGFGSTAMVDYGEAIGGQYGQLINTQNGTYAGQYMISTGSPTYFPFYNGRAARGTIDNPSAVQSGDVLIRFGAGGYYGSGWGTNNGNVEIRADGPWNTTSRPTAYSVSLTPVNSVTMIDRFFMSHDGNITVNGTLLIGNKPGPVNPLTLFEAYKKVAGPNYFAVTNPDNVGWSGFVVANGTYGMALTFNNKGAAVRPNYGSMRTDSSADGLKIGTGASGDDMILFVQDTDIFTIDGTDGSISIPFTYSDTVGATNRDLYIDDTGLIGYVSSSLDTKNNIKNITKNDTDKLMSLRPISFIYNNDSTNTKQWGLGAEEVVKVYPELVSNKTNITYRYFNVSNFDGTNTTGKEIISISTTSEPETVLYSKLPVLLLAKIQEQEQQINNLTIQLNQAQATLNRICANQPTLCK